jgi:hypothetical protein
MSISPFLRLLNSVGFGWFPWDWRALRYGKYLRESQAIYRPRQKPKCHILSISAKKTRLFKLTPLRIKTHQHDILLGICVQGVCDDPHIYPFKCVVSDIAR